MNAKEDRGSGSLCTPFIQIHGNKTKMKSPLCLVPVIDVNF